jgi:hypothetical protein
MEAIKIGEPAVLASSFAFRAFPDPCFRCSSEETTYVLETSPEYAVGSIGEFVEERFVISFVAGAADDDTAYCRRDTMRIL